jgi:hypothetical protein
MVTCSPAGGATKSVGQTATSTAQVHSLAYSTESIRVGFSYYDQSMGTQVGLTHWITYVNILAGQTLAFTDPVVVPSTWDGLTIRVRAEVQTQGGLTLVTADCPSIIVVPQ